MKIYLPFHPTLLQEMTHPAGITKNTSMNDTSPSREELARVRTRASLLARLRNAEDQPSWKEFFDTYWGLIYRFALRRGLSDDEAVEVCQETVITVARKIADFRYDPEKGRFSSWLFAIASIRVLKSREKRLGQAMRIVSDSNQDRAGDRLDEYPDPASLETDSIWEEEWKRNALSVATARARLRVNPEDYQRYDYVVTQGHTPEETATHLGCKLNTVYSARHRVVAAIKEELERLEKSRY